MALFSNVATGRSVVELRLADKLRVGSEDRVGS